ncbi:MAG: arginine--tRNA ligase [Planctomycetaceae bacterium]|nr:arginine--tRNA ligase [Planctomycetaceae bacterium]
MNILRTLRERFASVLADFTETPDEFAQMVRPAADSRFGDFQANFCMPLAKRNGVAPRDLALSVVDKLDVADLCTPPEVAGPGFINLTIRDELLQQGLKQAESDSRLGVDAVENPRNVIVDFSSPNVAKPMHVGHLRSTVIGDSICRILRFLGHNVTSDNHIGDWGTQFGMIIYGAKHFIDQAAYEQGAVSELSRLYRLVNQLSEYHAACAELPNAQTRLEAKQSELKQAEADADPADKSAKKMLKKLRSELEGLQESLEGLHGKQDAIESSPELKQLAQAHPDIARLAREETAKLHQGNEENRELWNKFLPECLAALHQVYDRLGIKFDLELGESFYDEMLGAVVSNLQQKGFAEESDGAQCVFIEGNNAPFIVQKSDGAFTYATTDLATIQYRVEKLEANEMLYVVDARQAEHFRMLFATASKWGYGDVKFEHVSFGTVLGKDKKPMKTRAGDNIGLESLLDEAVSRARAIVAGNDDAKTDVDGNPTPELDEQERDRIAEIVGLGGVKYADLHHNRESDYVFDWDKMLATSGDTATYMQYAYARLCGIFRKGNVDRAGLHSSPQAIVLGADAERALALELCRFEEALHAVTIDAKPNQLTQYLYELAGKLTGFYEQCPVLKADDPATRASRLKLVDLTGRTIREGLSLLGIGVREQM